MPRNCRLIQQLRDRQLQLSKDILQMLREQPMNERYKIAFTANHKLPKLIGLVGGNISDFSPTKPVQKVKNIKKFTTKSLS